MSEPGLPDNRDDAYRDLRRYLQVPVPFGEVPRLRSWLREWTELDLAGFALGLTLGIFPVGTSFRDVEGPLFKAGAVGERLVGMIQSLVDAGVLDSREDGFQVRWRA